jgi:hypothetical protein
VNKSNKKRRHTFLNVGRTKKVLNPGFETGNALERRRNVERRVVRGELVDGLMNRGWDFLKNRVRDEAGV